MQNHLGIHQKLIFEPETCKIWPKLWLLSCPDLLLPVQEDKSLSAKQVFAFIFFRNHTFPFFINKFIICCKIILTTQLKSSTAPDSNYLQEETYSKEGRKKEDASVQKARQGSLGNLVFLCIFWDLLGYFLDFGLNIKFFLVAKICFLSFSRQNHAESSRIFVKNSILEPICFYVTHFSQTSSFLTSRQHFLLEKPCSSGFWPKYVWERL